MLLTCVLKNFDPLSLSIKLHTCNFFGFLLSTIIIMVWPKLLIETKIKNLLQNCKHECNGPSRSLSIDM
jgi:hypothetical protein